MNLLDIVQICFITIVVIIGLSGILFVIKNEKK